MAFGDRLDLLERLFGDPGEGPADRATRNGTATGLGLSIVRAVAVAHHGDVVADREGGGARFTVTLPLARDRAKRLERTLPLA